MEFRRSLSEPIEVKYTVQGLGQGSGADTEGTKEKAVSDGKEITAVAPTLQVSTDASPSIAAEGGPDDTSIQKFKVLEATAAPSLKPGTDSEVVSPCYVLIRQHIQEHPEHIPDLFEHIYESLDHNTIVELAELFGVNAEQVNMLSVMPHLRDKTLFGESYDCAKDILLNQMDNYLKRSVDRFLSTLMQPFSESEEMAFYRSLQTRLAESKAARLEELLSSSGEGYVVFLRGCKAYLPVSMTYRIGPDKNKQALPDDLATNLACNPAITYFEQMQSPAGTTSAEPVVSAQKLQGFITNYTLVIEKEEEGSKNATLSRKQIKMGERVDLKKVEQCTGYDENTSAVLMHFLEFESLTQILDQATSYLKYRPYLSRQDHSCIVKLIVSGRGKIKVEMKHSFNKFVKERNKLLPSDKKSGNGQLKCTIQLLNNGGKWRIQHMAVDYEDDINKKISEERMKAHQTVRKGRGKMGGGRFSSSTSDLLDVESVISSRKTTGNEEWIVSDDIELAQKVRDGDLHIHSQLGYWEQQIVEVEKLLESGKFDQSLLTKFQRIYKQIKVNPDFELESVLNGVADKVLKARLSQALESSSKVAKEKREELTERCEKACQKYCELNEKTPYEVDRSCYSQEELPILDRLVQLYSDSMKWHIDQLPYLEESLKEELSLSDDSFLKHELSRAKGLDNESKRSIAHWREAGSEGAVLRRQLGFNPEDSASNEIRASAHNKANAFLPLSKRVMSQQTIMVKKLNRYIARLEEELAKRGN